MNKQELIDKLKRHLTVMSEVEGSEYDKGYKHATKQHLALIAELDEPEKPVVPQFVADFYESIKDDFEDKLYELCLKFNNDSDDLPGEIWWWFDCGKNEPIQTLVKMKIYGYEVEKEKLYTVKFANEDFGTIYIGIFKKFNKLGISSLPLNDDKVKSWFTKDELKELKFWDNPAFEVKEVEE
jgi:hypothetical protein